MANSTKKTQRDFYNEILNGYALTDEQREFIKGRIAQLDKKSTSSKGKETATQKANAELKDKILAEMEYGKSYTISEMLKAFECCADLSNQKVSAVCNQMVKDGLMTKAEDKRKSYFAKV